MEILIYISDAIERASVSIKPPVMYLRRRMRVLLRLEKLLTSHIAAEPETRKILR